MSEDRSLVESWAAYHQLPEGRADREALSWSYDEMSRTVRESPHRALHLIRKIHEQFPDDVMVANLAAGPLEDLLVAHGETVLPEIEELIKGGDEHLAKLLPHVWRNEISGEIWQRISHLV